jgi:hypothetical protein
MKNENTSLPHTGQDAKRYLKWLIVILASMLFFLPITPSGLERSFANEQDNPLLQLTKEEHPYAGKTMIDVSEAQNGTVGISGLSDSTLKVRITKGEERVHFDVPPDGFLREYPLTLGSGFYCVEVFEHVEGTTYSRIASENLYLDKKSTDYTYTHSNIMCSYEEESMALVAKIITRDARSDYERAEQILAWVDYNIIYDEAGADMATKLYIPDVVETITSRKGICLDRSAVSAAMLRSIGIPTQIATGYIDDNPTYHAWNRIFIDGEWIDQDMIENLEGSDLIIERTF